LAGMRRKGIGEVLGLGLNFYVHTPNIHAINVDVKIRWSTVYFHAQGFHIAL